MIKKRRKNKGTGITIHPMLVGSWEVDQSMHTFGFDMGKRTKSCCYIWLILGAAQKILVDTGCADPEWTRQYHRPMDADTYKNPMEALAAKGIRPEEIEIVINTHLHWDHCFNNDLFPKSRIMVQKKELQYAIAPLPIHALPYESQMIHMRPPWVKAVERIEAIEGDLEISPGVAVVTLPGHSKGFQGVLIDTSKGRHLIAGDTCPKEENWRGNSQLKHIPSGIHVDLEEYFKTFEKIEKIADVVIPGHDPRVMESPVYPLGSGDYGSYD